MIITKENDFSCTENNRLALAAMSVIGDRKTQEDCFGYQADDDYLLMCVCDGMGGHNGGSLASRTAVNAIVQSFDYGRFADHPTERLNELTIKANDEVLSLHYCVENAPNAGSTAVLVFIQNDLLYWSAVGDSRLYIWRKKEFIQMTKDQNYRTVLKEKRNAGVITEAEYEQGQVRGDALVNYLGVGELDLIDYNTEALRLKSGDRLVICTDGLYRILSDEEITGILNTDADVKSTLQMIEFAVRKKSKEMNVRRDNMTVSLIKVK